MLAGLTEPFHRQSIHISKHHIVRDKYIQFPPDNKKAIQKKLTVVHLYYVMNDPRMALEKEKALKQLWPKALPFINRQVSPVQYHLPFLQSLT